MVPLDNLSRFIIAQDRDYKNALSEINNGKKLSHWMWYIFPQIAGFGFSETSKYFAIKSLEEAKAYLDHDLLGRRLIEIVSVLLRIEGRSAYEIFSSPDDIKLKSCMTLFSIVGDDNRIFDNVLDKFFDGKRSRKTLKIIENL